MKWLFLVLLGCGGKSSDPPPLPEFDEADHGSDTATGSDTGDVGSPAPDFCDDAPTLSWNNFGQGFIREACQGCHATGVPNRYGAPESVVFDSVELTWAQADRVLARASGEYPSMPPLGGTHASDRAKLEYWLLCGEPGS